MRLGLERLINGQPDVNYLVETAYTPTKWNVGRGLVYKQGATPVDNYIAPDFQAIRPLEENVAFAISQVSAYNLSPTISYVFGIENSTAATSTRRIGLWELNRKSGSRSWKGYVILSLATASSYTVRDFRIDVKDESVGTVSVSGTTVTGAGTLFNTNRVAVGARVGFGSTNPALITTWYRIAAKGTDTSVTLSTAAPTVAAGTPYVIQEFRPVYTSTNTTTTNGGIHYAKGVSIEDFTPGGTTIPFATTVDDTKSVYWIKDALTQTNIVASGVAIDSASATPGALDCYVLDSVAGSTYKVYKYNLRAALVLTAGASTNAFTLVTGNQIVVGNTSQNANLCIATTNHGLGLNTKSLYFVSSSRLYRSAVSNITSGNASWINDSITEVPPGSVSTHAVTGALVTLDYLPSVDKFIVGTSHTGGAPSYLTAYVPSASQFEKVWGRDYRYLEQSLKDNAHPSLMSNQSISFTCTDAGGNRVFLTKQGTTGSTNHIYVVSFGSDWDFAATSQGRLISPAIVTSNALRYYRIFANSVRHLGDTKLGKVTEPFRLYARTANIATDATTGWLLIDDTADLSGFAGAAQIQFAIEFKTVGESCLPSRILGLNLSYEDNTTISNFAFDGDRSSGATKTFAWWFKTAFGTTTPALTIRLYNAITGGLLLQDTTASPAQGVFEKSTDGFAWSVYNTADTTNSTTYIRYVPTSLADNINVEVYLTQG
jgi:hypothetical protein